MSRNFTSPSLLQTYISYRGRTNNIPLILECLIIGRKYSCNCSEGYVWSNEVCYTHQCCSEKTCSHNLANVAQVCVAKAEGKKLPVFELLFTRFSVLTA